MTEKTINSEINKKDNKENDFKKLTFNLMENIVSKIEDEYSTFYIHDEKKIISKFTIKNNLTFEELQYITNVTADTITAMSNLNNYLCNDMTRILLYAIILDKLSSDFPVPKIKANNENEKDIYDLDKLQIWLNKINFETQLHNEFNNNLQESIYYMRFLVNEKIEFHKQQIIHNSSILKKFDYVSTTGVTIVNTVITELLPKLGVLLDTLDQDQIKIIVEKLSELLKKEDISKNNLAEMATKIYTAYRDKEDNQNVNANEDIDSDIIEFPHKLAKETDEQVESIDDKE